MTPQTTDESKTSTYLHKTKSNTLITEINSKETSDSSETLKKLTNTWTPRVIVATFPPGTKGSKSLETRRSALVWQ